MSFLSKFGADLKSNTNSNSITNLNTNFNEDYNLNPNPYLNSSFLVEIEDLIVGGFSEVTGLQVETDIEEIKEGGVNDYSHKLPKGNKQNNLTFKRGITNSNTLWKWHQDVVNGIIERKSGAILLLDFQEDKEIRWNFKEAYPIKWIGPNLNSKETNIAIETFELVHNGIYRL